MADREARLYQVLKQKLFLEDLQEELKKMETELKAKMAGEEVKEMTPEDLQKEQEKRAQRSADLEFQLRAKLADGNN